ncbi:MAG: undecaprenyl-diphosphate phosphatase [Mycobacteriales bacterium]|nr:MAG: undecaprenyl-diphosphatase [Pseudonocardiales bacterium]
MNVGEAAALGVVQGLTEFLPVSSSAHLRIVPALAGWKDPGSAFTAVVQLGTMLAVVIYFWREIVHLVAAWVRGIFDRSVRHTAEYRMAWYVIFATIPISILGLAFNHQINHGARNLWLIASTMTFVGLILLLAERVGHRDRGEDDLRLRDGLLIGVAQSAALVPGVSRSGATITAGLFRGLERTAAARFSFLLSIPAVVLSGGYELKDVGKSGGPGMGVTGLAAVLAFIVGIASIHWLLRYLTRHSTGVFVAYRVVLGVVLFALLANGTITAT